MTERGADANQENFVKRLMFGLGILFLGAVAVRPVLAQDSPFIGTWKLKTAKSNSGSMPMPKSLPRPVTADGSDLKYAYDGVAADGNAITYGFSTNFDGKASSVMGSGIPGGERFVT